MSRVLFILLATISIGQSVRSQNRELKPSFFAVNVANIDTSINWYTRVFDLKIRNRVDNPIRGFKQAILHNKDVMIELVELNHAISFDSVLKGFPKETKFLGVTKIGFVVPNIDSTYQQCSNLRLVFHGQMVTDPVDKKRTFLVKDPDGNLLQFFEE